MRNYLLRMEREGIQKVKMFSVITAAYLLFWGPLFFVTIVKPLEKDGNEIYEVSIFVIFSISFPTGFPPPRPLFR